MDNEIFKVALLLSIAPVNYHGSQSWECFKRPQGLQRFARPRNVDSSLRVARWCRRKFSSPTIMSSISRHRPDDPKLCITSLLSMEHESTNDSNQTLAWTDQPYFVPHALLDNGTMQPTANGGGAVLIFNPNAHISVTYPILLRPREHLVILGGSEDSRTCLTVSHFSISKGHVAFEKINFTTKLVITGATTVSFKSCFFVPAGRTQEGIVEVRGSDTHVSFSDCTFEGATQVRLS
jgi:hypothetical protein